MCVVAMAVLQTVSAPAQKAARSVEQRPGIPIEQLIVPGEAAIELRAAQFPPLTVEGRETGPLASWLLATNDVAMYVRLDSRRPKLSQGRDWVESDLDFTVLEVFKAPKDTLKAGAKMRFVEDGGELDVKGTAVKARVPWVKGFQSGQSYLMFLGVDPDKGQIYFDPSGFYELVDGRFVRISRPRGAADVPNELEQDLSDHVLAELRELARASGQWRPGYPTLGTGRASFGFLVCDPRPREAVTSSTFGAAG
jgi:hypothetical protein